MADRWNERDRNWRDRDRSYQDWRDRDDRRTERSGRSPEERSWYGGHQEDRSTFEDEDEDDYSSRLGVTSGGALYQTGRGYGQERSGSQRFASQDYTGRQGRERERGEHGAAQPYGGQGWRSDPTSAGRPRAYRSDRSDWEDEGPAFAYRVERHERRTWERDDDYPQARDRQRRDFDRYDRDRRADDRYRDRAEDRYRAERGDHDRDRRREHDEEERRGGAAGDFLHRAGERISSWFRGDNLMRGSPDDEREYYRSDFGREQRPLHRGVGPKGYQRSDDRISDEVHQRLTYDPWIDASEIDVEVKSGEVTLTGHVDNREAKHRAERLIEDLSGVRHVQNNLRINPNASLTSAGRGYGSSALEAQMRRNEQASDPGDTGASGLSGRTSTGAAAQRSTNTSSRTKRT